MQTQNILLGAEHPAKGAEQSGDQHLTIGQQLLKNRSSDVKSQFSLVDKCKEGADYYNKEIIKKQHYNIIKKVDSISSSSNQQDNNEVKDLQLAQGQEITQQGIVPLSTGQQAAKPKQQEQMEAPAPPQIFQGRINRVCVQLWRNQKETGFKNKCTWKLKVQIVDTIDGEPNTTEWVAALTQDMRIYNRYHPEESAASMMHWAKKIRSQFKEAGVDHIFVGKFHECGPWDERGEKFNQIEPWTSCLACPDVDDTWAAVITMYDLKRSFMLTTEGITDRQAKRGLVAQHIWNNHGRAQQRPKTWAQRRFGK